MRKFFMLLIASFALFCPAFSQGENEEVIIINVLEKNPTPSKNNRVPARPQIECYYYPSSNSVDLSFLSNIGTVCVALENLATGDVRDYVSDSSTGRMILLVASGVSYRMDITTGNGRNYYAVFFTGSEDFE